MATIVATLATIYAPYPDGTGMALLVMIWVPLIIGLVTVGAFFSIRAVAGRGEWVATALGVAFLLFWSVTTLWR